MLPNCKRGQNCAFYHNILEKRIPEKASKDPFKKKKKIPLAELLKTPPAFMPYDPGTNETDEPNFEFPNRRRHWTVYTKHEKLMSPEIIKASFAHECDERKYSRSDLSSLVNSFCSSKGLPYYTELAFENNEGSDNEAENKEEKIEDKFNVLDQIGTPKGNTKVLINE